jgi:hypothetical protein
MAEYIATFFSHYGATAFARELRNRGVASRTMPVPRHLSSSCGSCVAFTGEEPLALLTPEVEAVYAPDGTRIWHADQA